MKEMTLREVCHMAGVTRRAVQGYEKEGLVMAAGRNKYGHLLYDTYAVERIMVIKMYRDFGFRVKDIKGLLEASGEQYKELLTERLEQMKEQLTELERNISRMEQLISG